MQQQSDEPRTPFIFTNWELFEPLKKHKAFITVFTLSAALTALLITYVVSEKYEGETTFLFNPTEVTRLREHSQEAFGSPVPQPDYRVVGTTLRDLAGSEPLLRRVVTRLKLDVPDSRDYVGPYYIVWYNRTKDYVKDTSKDLLSILKYGRVIVPDPTAGAIVTLHKNIEIVNRDSYVFALRVRDTHKERVADIANAIADELVALLQQSEQERAGLRSVQIKEHLNVKRAEIVSYRKRITDLLDSNRVVSIAEEAGKDVDRYSTLELTRLNTEATIHEIEASLQSYNEKLGQGIAPSGDVKRPVGRLEFDMATVIPPAVPASRARRLPPEDFKRLTSEKLDAEVRLNGLYAKRASLVSSVEALTSHMQRLAPLQVTYEELTTRVGQLERDYTLLNDAYAEALIQEQNNATNLVMQNSAIEPQAPAEPIKIYHVGLATALSLQLSLGLAFLFGYFNIRLFVPSKGVKGRRALTNESAGKDEQLPNADGSQFASLPPQDVGSAASLQPAMPRKRTRRRSRGATLADRLGWATLIFLAILTGLTAVQYRQTVTDLWPQAAPLYRALGLPVDVSGMALADIRYQHELEGGQPVLAVTGKIVNVTNRELPVPAIRVELANGAQQEIFHWNFKVGIPSLKPGAESPFTTRLASPPPEARVLNIRFAEAGETQ